MYIRKVRARSLYVLNVNLGDPVSFFTTDNPAIILETVKTVSGL